MTEEQKQERLAKKREYMRRYSAEKRKDPEYVEKYRQYHREYAREWGSDPEHRERIRARNREQYLKKKLDPERAEKERERARNKYHRYKDSPSQRRWNRSNVCQAKGITVEQYEEMLAKQGGCCAICKKPQEDMRRKHLCIDHDHRTGAVRGLLCEPCNWGLGSLKDDVDLIRKAIAYLEFHKS